MDAKMTGQDQKGTLEGESVEVVREAASRAVTVTELARQMTVETREDYERGMALIKDLKAAEAMVRGVYDPLVASAHAHHKMLTAERAKELGPIEQATTFVRGKVNKFIEDQERARAAAERAERERKMREAEEKRLAEAVFMEQAVGTEQATALLEKPLTVQAVKPAPAFKPAAGTSVSWRTTAEIVELNAILLAVVAGDMPASIVSINPGPLNQWAATQTAKGDQEEMIVCGVRISKKPVTTVRG